MKLIQMQAFREIMLTGSVSEAARNLRRTQPAISSSIASLERELEMPLFERKNGRLHPVPEARYLMQECSEVLNRVATLKQNMSGIKKLESGRIEIVSMPGPSVFLLPDLIADFVLEKPEIECVLISRSSDIVHQLVAAQRYDLGVADFIKEKADETTLLKTETYEFATLCALNRNDPLASETTITPEMLQDKPLASLYSGHQVFQNTEKVFAEANCRLNIRFTTQYFIPLLTFVERNLACGLIDPMSARSYEIYSNQSDTVVFKPFVPAISYRTSLLMPAFRTASLLIQSFTDKLRQEIHNLDGHLI